MDAIEFVANYNLYLEEIKSVTKPEILPIIDELKSLDPHDLIRPDSWFHSENDAKGYVWALFINKARKYNQIEFQ